MFKPALNITEQIADHLGQKIILGELKSGARIQEVKIAKSMNVSRGSVREALLILERRHLISIVPRKGASVSDLEIHDGIEVMNLLATLQDQLFQKVMCNRLASDVLAVAETSVAEMEAAARLGDRALALKAHREFYATLLAVAGNCMAGVLESLLPSVQRLLHVAFLSADFDLYDFARFHKALHAFLKKKDKKHVSDLLSAFSRRTLSLLEGCLAHRGGAGYRRGYSQEMAGAL